VAVKIESLSALNSLAGHEFAVTDWVTVTQERIQQFADATGDQQWIHTDAERAAKESPHGATIAHGFMTLSLLSEFMKQAVELPSTVRITINYGLNRVRFPAPVKAGSEIRARIALLSTRNVGDAVEAEFQVTIEAEGGQKPCCVADWLLRYYPLEAKASQVGS
jgi:acyl dehydratase